MIRRSMMAVALVAGVAGQLMAQWVTVVPGASSPPGVFLGLEYAELLQNPNEGINGENWSLVGGLSSLILPAGFGMSYLGFDVQLGDDHLQDPRQVGFLEGPRETITGDVSAHRLWIDWSPGLLAFGPETWRALTAQPIVMVGPGWNRWVFEERAGSDRYQLNAATFSLGLRLRSTIGELVFIENPLFDAFVYLWKSRTVAGSVGDVQITRPEGFGLFSWATIGIDLGRFLR